MRISRSLAVSPPSQGTNHGWDRTPSPPLQYQFMSCSSQMLLEKKGTWGVRKKSLLNNSLLFTATFPVISNMSFCAPCSSNIFILSDFWIPKRSPIFSRSPLSPFQAEERAKSQSSHYLLNVDHLNACDDKTSFNESHASLSMKLSFVLKWRCFPIIFLLCISRN